MPSFLQYYLAIISITNFEMSSEVRQITSEIVCIWIKEKTFDGWEFYWIQSLVFHGPQEKRVYFDCMHTKLPFCAKVVYHNVAFLRTSNTLFNVYYNQSGKTWRKFKITGKEDCSYWLTHFRCAFLNKVSILWPNTTIKSSILVLYYSQLVSAVQMISHHQLGVV